MSQNGKELQEIEEHSGRTVVHEFKNRDSICIFNPVGLMCFHMLRNSVY